MGNSENATVRDYYNERVEYMSQVKPRHDWIFASLEKIVKPTMSVLDVGCGTGITTEKIRSLGAYAVGIDISDKLIEKGKELHPYVSFLCADFSKVDMGRKYDLVCLIDVLEHVLPHDIPEFLANVSNHSNGMIYLNAPDGRYIQYLEMYHPEVLQVVDEAYRIEHIIEMFSNIGYTPISINLKDLQYQEYVFWQYKRLDDQYAKMTEVL